MVTATDLQISRMKRILAEGFTDLRQVASRMSVSSYTAFNIFNDGLMRREWGITITDPATDGPEVNILRNLPPTKVPAGYTGLGPVSTAELEPAAHLRRPVGGYHD